LTGGLLCSTAYNTVAGFMADRMGRRRMLVFFGMITVLSGVIFAMVSNPLVLVPVAIVSTLGYRGGFGPANMLERVILAQSCPEERRTRMYAIRSTLNSVATSAGSFFVGVVVLLQGVFVFGLTPVASYKWMFWIYAIMNGVVVVLYSLLSEAAEVELKSEEAPLFLLIPGVTS
jgi:MFS family permease